jgi:hypothetical protein
MHFSATDVSVGTGIANCMHSGERPGYDMFIVSYGPLQRAGQAYSQRCDVALADEYLSRSCLIFFFLTLQEVPFFIHVEGILYSI